MSEKLSKQSKTIWLFVIAIIMIALAILVYQYQKGSFETSADVLVSTNEVEMENAVPLFRYYNPTTGDHFYTTAIHGTEGAESNWQDLVPEGILGYCSSTQVEGTAPIYRFYNGTDHYYTMDKSDVPSGYTEEDTSPICYAYTEELEGTEAVYQYENKANGDHFYTQAYFEKSDEEIWTNLVPYGDGILGYFYQPVEDLVPVFRYYSSDLEDHFYTTAIHGDPDRESNWDLYVSEGITGYCYSSQKEGTVPIYRYWNSVDEDHFYTQAPYQDPDREVWTNLVEDGVLCYAYPDQSTGTVPVYRYLNTVTKDHFYTQAEFGDSEKEVWTNLVQEGESVRTLAYFYPYPLIDLSYSYEFILTASVDENGDLVLTWTSVEGASYYSIYDCEGNLVADSITDTTYTIEDVTDGEYCYYIVAYDADGNILGQTGSTTITVDNGEVIKRDDDDNGTVVDNGSSSSSSTNTSSDSSNSGISAVSSLVSTGASLWFNILIAVAIIAVVGYFMFRDEIFNKE